MMSTGGGGRAECRFRLYVPSAGKVRQIALPLPSIADQQAVVKELEQMQSRIRQLVELQAKSEQELQAMLPAVLDRALRGSGR
jgi:type I restriction enzyme S subunit